MIKELHEKLKNKKISSVKLTEDYLDKIEEKDKKLNAFLSVHKGSALEKATEVDDRISRGENIDLLEGIPCAVKDNICIEGKKATGGSRILENYVAPYDAGVIKKLKKQNPVFLGKTNLDEFAMGSSTENSAFKTTKNPHDESRVPGGSSGGSAAAVAGGLAPWALGSDTGGSIRQPAGFCGVVGLKPTYGRVSRSGLLAMASSYDQIGSLTNSVEDAAIVLDAISGVDKKDNTTVKTEEYFFENLKPELKGKKIGILKEFMGEGIDEEVKKIVEEKIDWAKSEGAEIVEIELPHINYAMAVYYLMMPAEVSSNLARLDGIKYGLSDAVLENSQSKDILDVYFNSRKLGFGPEVKRRIILGTYVLSAGYYDAYYKKAQKVRELIKADFKKVFEEVDVILTPTSPTPAFKIGEKTDNPLEMYLSDIYTVPANVAMLPAISLPAGSVEKNDKKLPVGLQLIGKWWDEQNILNISEAFEEKV
jgi:aspartyl-tRNA(Asn)/glutamyl-tRNA(Gln) amidotransferase subunit A